MRCSAKVQRSDLFPVTMETGTKIVCSMISSPSSLFKDAVCHTCKAHKGHGNNGGSYQRNWYTLKTLGKLNRFHFASDTSKQNHGQHETDADTQSVNNRLDKIVAVFYIQKYAAKTAQLVVISGR